MAKNMNEGAGIDLSALGQPNEESSQVAELKALIAQLTAQNQALVDARATNVGENAAERQAASKERYGIIIDEGHDANDISEVPVQVNGRAYQIKRGQYVEVPPEVVSVLKDAVVDKAVANFDPNGMPNGIKLRPSRRFPFQEFGLAVNAAGERVKEPQPNVA